MLKKIKSPFEIIRINSEQLHERVMLDKMFYGKDGGVTCSGGEPLLHPEFTYEFLKKCKNDNITTAVETCLYVPLENIKMNISVVDTWIVDLKIINEYKHKKYTGSNNETILKNFEWLCDNANDVWVRSVVVPGVHEDGDIKQFCNVVKGKNSVTNIQLIPFHILGREKYEKLFIECPYPVDAGPSEKYMDDLINIVQEYDLPINKED